jgi:hypothetical protein
MRVTMNKLYDPKFSSARTKTEAIIVNVISPFIFDNVLRSLGNINYVTVTVKFNVSGNC